MKNGKGIIIIIIVVIIIIIVIIPKTVLELESPMKWTDNPCLVFVPCQRPAVRTQRN